MLLFGKEERRNFDFFMITRIWIISACIGICVLPQALSQNPTTGNEIYDRFIDYDEQDEGFVQEVRNQGHDAVMNLVRSFRDIEFAEGGYINAYNKISTILALAVSDTPSSFTDSEVEEISAALVYIRNTGMVRESYTVIYDIIKVFRTRPNAILLTEMRSMLEDSSNGHLVEVVSEAIAEVPAEEVLDNAIADLNPAASPTLSGENSADYGSERTGPGVTAAPGIDNSSHIRIYLLGVAFLLLGLLVFGIRKIMR